MWSAPRPLFCKEGGKHASTKIEAVFSAWSVRRLYNDSYTHNKFQILVEAGSNTSTVTLRVIEGVEKGSLKYGRESQGIRTRERLRWQEPAAIANDRSILSSEGRPTRNKTVK
jgi:hypothetical protein